MAQPRQVTIPPLATALEKVSGPRDAKGKHHFLIAMLLLASVALLYGRHMPLAISQWAEDYGHEYRELTARHDHVAQRGVGRDASS